VFKGWADLAAGAHGFYIRRFDFPGVLILKM
jgi:hypothetical protein